LIIAVELADARDGVRLWGEQYHRPTSDVLTVQDEIVRAVVYQLRLKLNGAERQHLAKRYTENTTAYQLYLQGRYHYLQYNLRGLEKALGYFQQAVAADPNYALAYTGIADVYAEYSGQFLAPSEAMPRAREAAMKAMALDDTLAEAHHSLAMIKWWSDWDWPGAEREFRRALDLNPNAAWTYMYYADFLMRLKRFDESLAAARRGHELDPLTAPVNDMLSKSLFYLGRCSQAVEHMRKTLDLNPNYGAGHEIIGRCFARQGQYEQAIAEMRQMVALHDHDRLLAVMGSLYGIAGQRDEALKTLAEFKRRARERRVSQVYLARVYAGMGDKKRALDLLYQGYAERSDHMLAIGIDPDFDSLRSEPRFVDLLRRVGLPH
jgi:tetratricopeptide (TPR) repeat protein